MALPRLLKRVLTGHQVIEEATASEIGVSPTVAGASTVQGALEAAVITHTVTLTPTQIKSNSPWPTVLSAPVGKVPIVVSATAFLDFGSVSYTVSGEAMLEYLSSGVPTGVRPFSFGASWLAAAQDDRAIAFPFPFGAAIEDAGFGFGDIVLSDSNSTPPADGDSPVTITLAYYLVDAP